jgi:hypothetical protein
MATTTWDLQHRLVTRLPEKLGIEHLRAVLGMPMGGGFTKRLERTGGSPREVSDGQRIRSILDRSHDRGLQLQGFLQAGAAA